MSQPTIQNLNYTYKKPGTDVWVLNTNDIPVEKEKIRDMQIVHLAPKSVGGNHKHLRVEWFIGLGNMLFIWLDEKGEKHEEEMNPNGQIRLITVPPFVPHAVVNVSQDKEGILFEMADGKMAEVEVVKVY